jgi:TonB family protein
LRPPEKRCHHPGPDAETPAFRRTPENTVRHLFANRHRSCIAPLALTAVLLAGCAAQDRPLQLVSGTGPVYPPEARAEGVEGFAVVRYDVDEAGRVVNARVVDSSPQGVFDQSALRAVTSWKFRPAERAGEPQSVNGLESRLDFRVKGGEAYADH